MKKLSLALAFLCVVGCEEDKKSGDDAREGDLVWVRNIDDADTTALSVTTDTAGNTLAFAVFYGVAKIGEEELGAAETYSLVLTKYAATGSLLFTKAFTGTFSADTDVHVATDKDNAVVFALHNPGGTITLDEERAGATVAKLSGSDGDALYSLSLQLEDEERHLRDLVLDADGDILVIGTTRSTLGETPEPDRLFVTKLRGSDGEERFARVYGEAESSIIGEHLAATTTGDFLVSGVFTGTFALDTQATTQPTGTNYFVARLSDDDGEVTWALPLQGPAEAPSLSIAAGPSDEVLVVGELSFPADLTDDSIQAGSISIAKIDGTDGGKLIWRAYILASDEDPLQPGSVAVDSKGAVIMTAGFTGSLTMKGTTWNSGDRTSMVVAKWSADKGELVWARSASGSGNTRPLDVAVDLDTNVVASGILSKVDANDAVTRELFVMKLTP